VTKLESGKVDFRSKNITRNKEVNFIVMNNSNLKNLFLNKIALKYMKQNLIESKEKNISTIRVGGFFVFVFYFWWYWGLNLGAHTSKAGTLALKSLC
jgi:hypothetical protein